MIAPVYMGRRLSTNTQFKPRVSTVHRKVMFWGARGARNPHMDEHRVRLRRRCRDEASTHVLSNSLVSSFEGDKNLELGFSEWWRSSGDLVDDKYSMPWVEGNYRRGR